MQVELSTLLHTPNLNSQVCIARGSKPVNEPHTTLYEVSLSMWCLIEQSDAYMQRSSSHAIAPAVNIRQSDAQLKHSKVYSRA